MAETYGDNFGFRNFPEWQQFSWFKEILDSEYKLFHNFYVCDPINDCRRWEIDFGILSTQLLLLIEHKSSLLSAEKVKPKMNRMHSVALRFFRGTKELSHGQLPWIDTEIITNSPHHKNGEHDKINVIKSKSGTRSFYERKIKGRDNHGRRVSLRVIKKILTALDCDKYEYRQFDTSIFDIFRDMQEFEKWEPEPTAPKRNEFVSRIYRTFSPINYIVSEVFLNLDRKRVDQGKQPVFNLHKASEDHLTKWRPTYWVCATNSEDENYANYFQLGFHVSDGNWYSENVKAKPKKHLAIKLAFFDNIHLRLLKTFQNRLRNERDEFTKLVSALHKVDSGFEFYRTLSYRDEREQISIDGGLDEQLVQQFMDYDKKIAIPRSTEFVKYVIWDDEIKTIFKKKKRAIEFLTREFEKLLPLYYFMTDQ